MKKNLLFLVSLLFLICSCGGGDEPNPQPPGPNPPDPNKPPVVVDFLDLSLTTINFTSEKDASLVVVKTNLNWTVTKNADWILLSASSGNKNTGFLIGAPANNGFLRETTITIKAGDKSKDIKITQNAPEKIKFTLKGVDFTLLPVEAEQSFVLQGGIYYETHNVVLSDYYISETEITNAQWFAVMGSLPYTGEDDFPNLPVIVNWNKINNKFLPEIRKQTHYEKLRLPTQSEWRVAALGGKLSKNTEYSGSIYVDEVAWYYNNSQGIRHNVGLKKANELGLYDMSGNAAEWCYDWYKEWSEENPPPNNANNPKGPESGTEKVVMGGDIRANRLEYDINSCAIYKRNHLPPDYNALPDAQNITGFRLVISKADY